MKAMEAIEAETNLPKVYKKCSRQFTDYCKVPNLQRSRLRHSHTFFTLHAASRSAPSQAVFWKCRSSPTVAVFELFWDHKHKNAGIDEPAIKSPSCKVGPIKFASCSWHSRMISDSHTTHPDLDQINGRHEPQKLSLPSHSQRKCWQLHCMAILWAVRQTIAATA